MANVLIYAPFSLWSPHYETDLELAQTCLDNGDSVTIIQCDATLTICEPNPTQLDIACQTCMAKRDNGIKWLNNKNIELISLKLNAIDTKEIDEKISSMGSIEDVRGFSIEANDLGMGAISSTISFYREPELVWDKHGMTLLNHLRNSLLVYYRFKRLLTQRPYDKIFLFNGRFSALRPLLRLAQQRNIPTYVHERGQDLKHYSLTENTYPHNIQNIEDQILSFAQDDIPEEDKKSIGSKWFIERQQHIQQNWTVFTETQKDGLLPEKMTNKVFNIAIFNSSEDEFSAIEEWKNPYYSSQNIGIEKILNDINESDIHFYLRVHPNLKNVYNSQTIVFDMFKKKYKNLNLIDADSEVSTYDLVKNVDLVITFGSSVGIEASFIGTPSIVMGKAPYLILNSCIQPINHQAMIDIIQIYKDTGFLPKTNNNSYLYGYYMKTRGKPFRYVEQIGISKAILKKDKKRTNLNYSKSIYLILGRRVIRKLGRLFGGE